MLWESTRPNNLTDILTHTVLVNNLNQLAQRIKKGAPFQNLIICGPSQAGKLTITRCFLSSIFGDSIYKLETIDHSVRQNCSNYLVKLHKNHM